MQNKQTDEDKVLKDGARFVVPLVLMDGMQRSVVGTQPVSPVGHRPGSLPLTDAARQHSAALHDKARTTLSNRWRNPPAVATAAEVKQPVKDTPTDMAAAYARADAKLRERWRGAA